MAALAAKDISTAYVGREEKRRMAQKIVLDPRRMGEKVKSRG